MAIATNNSRVYSALQLKNKKDSMYLAIGKTSPWTNEDVPPEADPANNTLQEVIGFKKVKKTSLCREYVEGDEAKYPVTEYGTKKFTLIPDDQAYTEKAWMVYVEAELIGKELPLGTFRQVGLHIDVQPKSGVTKEALLPSEVTSTGLLHFFDNRKQQNRTEDLTLREKFIITMENGKTLK